MAIYLKVILLFIFFFSQIQLNNQTFSLLNKWQSLYLILFELSNQRNCFRIMSPNYLVFHDLRTQNIQFESDINNVIVVIGQTLLYLTSFYGKCQCSKLFYYLCFYIFTSFLLFSFLFIVNYFT